MGLINVSRDEPRAESESVEVLHRVDVREPLSDDNARIVARILSILENLNVESIRVEKGRIDYIHYPSYKSGE